MLRSTFLLLVLLAACRSAAPTSGDGGSAATPERAEDAALLAIAEVEAHGEDREGALLASLSGGTRAERRAAALALARIEPPRGAAGADRALVAATADEAPEVRAAAAFALGQRALAVTPAPGTPEVAAALAAAVRDADPGVRAAAVTAASLRAPEGLRDAILYAVGDEDAGVRAAALVATHRLDPAAPGAAEVDARLVLQAQRAAALRFDDVEAPTEGPHHDSPDEVHLTLFALGRRVSERGRDSFRTWSRAGAPVEARIFALRGLTAIGPDEADRALLRRALDDADWRVAVEAARGLSKVRAAEDLPALEAALSHRSPHVRRTVAAGLASFEEQREEALAALERAGVDTSPSVRAAVIAARGALSGDDFAPDLEMLAFDADPVVRVGVAEAAAALPSARAIPLLTQLSRDRFPSVSGAAVLGLGEHLTDEGRTRVHMFLSNEDNGLRLAALVALANDPQPQDLRHLEYAWRTSEGEIASEIRAEVLDRAAAIEGERARELLERGVMSTEPYIAQRARALILERDPAATFPPLPRIEGPRPTPVVAGGPAPLVELRTNRGVLLFELLPDEAPRHVRNFVGLVESGHYDGLDWHRVVPDFVAQGGDHRGDGNGSRRFDGRPLRREFTARPFRRGTLGMPRNADPDSGGSQVFVCHRATPHLDGRYTAFGELVQGGEVLDALEVGDRILTARVRGAGGR